jgi:hypothetical protein
MDKRPVDRPGEECGGHTRSRRVVALASKRVQSKRVRRTRFVAALVRGNRDAGSGREATH